MFDEQFKLKTRVQFQSNINKGQVLKILLDYC